MKDWIFYKPLFEYKKTLDKSLDAFGWVGHTIFAYDLVSNLKPKVVVELGTHWGVSFFSFCQAAKDNSPTTRLYAVDTWHGEEHTGYYGDKVITKVREIKKRYFGSLHTKLFRKTFDEALVGFENHSIDILHIDGLHTYEAVKHDFESWLPKLKKNGIVLFHDTIERGRGFGVYRFWGELERRYAHTIELPHCHGLGILCESEEVWATMKPLKRSLQVYYSLYYEKEKQLGESKKNIAEMSQSLRQTRNIIGENISLCRELLNTEKHLYELETALNEITSSIFYKLWSKYNEFKRLAKGERHGR